MDMEKRENRLIKWMLGIVFGQIAVIIGLFGLFL
jgi:hypothetical protein